MSLTATERTLAQSVVRFIPLQCRVFQILNEMSTETLKGWIHRGKKKFFSWKKCLLYCKGQQTFLVKGKIVNVLCKYNTYITKEKTLGLSACLGWACLSTDPASTLLPSCRLPETFSGQERLAQDGKAWQAMSTEQARGDLLQSASLSAPVTPRCPCVLSSHSPQVGQLVSHQLLHRDSTAWCLTVANRRVSNM